MAHSIPPGYDSADVEQHGTGEIAEVDDSDARTPFQHDVDRIMYSTEFRSLGGRTQVVSSDQLGNNHNRLTHSLKVAQVGRRLANILGDRARRQGAEATPDLDLVEAACLLHDIGHPVFGHMGEQEITSALDAHSHRRHPDGYQANAQNLRIAVQLGVRSDRGAKGLNLTRATLDASIKYPWHRGPKGSWSGEHWGCYRSEDPDLKWILQAKRVPSPPKSKAAQPRRPVEEQIMDWADEVTYACHDVEDFYRAGLIPLDRILGLRVLDTRSSRTPTLTYEAEEFLRYLEHDAAAAATAFDRDVVIGHLMSIQNLVNGAFPYESTRAGRGRSIAMTSALLGYFLGPEVTLEAARDGATNWTRYDARLVVPTEMRAVCRILKKLIWCYVIDRPGLATQQHGQQTIVRKLVEWYVKDPMRLLPAARREEYLEHKDSARAAADHVASLTEAEAVVLYRRMAGVDYGQVGDQ